MNLIATTPVLLHGLFAVASHPRADAIFQLACLHSTATGSTLNRLARAWWIYMLAHKCTARTTTRMRLNEYPFKRIAMYLEPAPSRSSTDDTSVVPESMISSLDSNPSEASVDDSVHISMSRERLRALLLTIAPNDRPTPDAFIVLASSDVIISNLVELNRDR
jgi:hypothetical protein